MNRFTVLTVIMKILNKNLSHLVVCCLAASLLTGCAKGTGGVAYIFDGASPEIKAAWSKATAADLANEFVTAANGYQLILSQADKLSVEQCQSVTDARCQLFSRLNIAAKKGEPGAVKALDTLRRSVAH